ncbi:MAG: permease prefix domain 1-containing protein [Oscillospiraceae bacterium]
MKQKLTEYVDALFRSAALTVRNAELKEEIMQNTLEKYDDLIADGKTPDEAYRAAVDGIGDISGLIEPAYVPPRPPEETAVSVAKGEKTVHVEANFGGADAEAEDDLRRRKKLLNSATGTLWLAFVALYFLWSFASGKWYISWVIFLIAPGVTDLVTAVFYWNVPEKRKKVRGCCVGAMWMFMLAAYFVVSFATGAWHVTWVMFLIAAALSCMLNACFDLRREER